MKKYAYPRLRNLCCLIALFLLAAPPGFGRSVEAMFHPYDPTLKRIASWFMDSRESIDIAMYSLDFSSENPIVAALQSPELQDRIKSGRLKIRMIYEGYSGRANALEMAQNLEALGVDVRFLASGRKVHHKFAIFDYEQDSRRLVSGSANWSMASYENYDENLLFIKDEPGLIRDFQGEFDKLWSASEEVGLPLVGDIQHPLLTSESAPIKAFFNSNNFTFSGLSLSKAEEGEGYTITRAIVKAIDDAKDSLKIATTRIQLRPVYDALLRAASRGLKIQIIVNLDQYAYEDLRKDWMLSPCVDAYEESCSLGIDFSYYLSEGTYPGKDMVSLRIKFTDIDVEAFLGKQMHAKYLIADDRYVLSGSFNWSVSGEYQHLENLIVFDGWEFSAALQGFLFDFYRIFERGRSFYSSFSSRLDQAFVDGQKIECRFAPMSLTFSEIDYLLAAGKRHGAVLKDACLY